jgi:hypothetical protein
MRCIDRGQSVYGTATYPMVQSRSSSKERGSKMVVLRHKSDRSGSVCECRCPVSPSDTCGRGTLPNVWCESVPPSPRPLIVDCTSGKRGRCTQHRFAFRRESLRICERTVKENVNWNLLREGPITSRAGRVHQVYSDVGTVSTDTFARYGESACSARHPIGCHAKIAKNSSHTVRTVEGSRAHYSPSAEGLSWADPSLSSIRPDSTTRRSFS